MTLYGDAIAMGPESSPAQPDVLPPPLPDQVAPVAIETLAELNASTPVVTDTWVVRAVVVSLALAIVAIVAATAVLNAIDAPGLPGELTAIAPTATGALGALLAGTLTARARS